MNQVEKFRALTRVVFGEGALQQSGELLAEFGVTKAQIITDQGIMQTGMIDQVSDSLEATGISRQMFDNVESDPSIQTVEAAVQQYRKTGCDSILAIGGGSPIDAAKAVGVLATNTGDLYDYFGIDKVKNPLPPLFAIPTTVGTGSEVTTFAVISDVEQNKKMVIGTELIAPQVAILDPTVVRSLPPRLIAATGIDTLAHAIESVISLFANPFSDALAFEAIYLANTNLKSAMQADHLEAKANMLYASTMAGQAFSYARTGLVHGMAHPVGSYYHIHHGLAIAILLPYVLEYNLPSCEAKLERVAVAMGGQPDARAAINAVRQLKSAVGIPEKLSEVGVTGQHLTVMARDAQASGNAQVVNPRKPTLEEVEQIYYAAL